MRVAYLHGAKLVGNCRKLQHEAIISDLEYTDDMALVVESWDDLNPCWMMCQYGVKFRTHLSCSKT